MANRNIIPGAVPKKIVKTYNNGVTEGRRQVRAEVLSFLEEKYMTPGIIKGTVEGDAILELAKQLANHIR